MRTHQMTRWRQQRREEGLESLTLWLPADAKARLLALASTQDTTPAQLVLDWLSAVTVTPPTVTVTQPQPVTVTLPAVTVTRLETILTRLETLAHPPVTVKTAPVTVTLPAVTVTAPDVTVTDQTEPPKKARGQGTYFLGKLCKRRHDHEGTGQSLRRYPSGGCHQCNMEGQEARRQAKVRANRAARPPLRIVEHP